MKFRLEMKWKTIPLLLSILLAVSPLAGCSGRSPETDPSAADTASQEQSGDVSGGFDWETVRQDITLDGMKIAFPFSVKDLGDDYEIRYVTDDLMGENNCYGTVEKKGEYTSETICMVFFDGIRSDAYDENVKCTRISSADTLTVQGIRIGSSLEDAEKLFGKPYWTGNDEKHYLSKSGKERIELYYDAETNKVTEVQITLNPEALS